MVDARRERTQDTGKRDTGEQARSVRDESSDRPVDVDAGASGTPGETSAAGADDLTEIRGIGPAIARKLEELGVHTFADLAKSDPEDLAGKIARRPGPGPARGAVDSASPSTSQIVAALP